MRSPRRLSRPTTSERRRPRREPSDRPETFRGIWTRRPSARMAMATWRRLRPPNRSKNDLPNEPGRPGWSAQSTRRLMIAQPPGPHRHPVATSGPSFVPWRSRRVALRPARVVVRPAPLTLGSAPLTLGPALDTRSPACRGPRSVLVEPDATRPPVARRSRRCPSRRNGAGGITTSAGRHRGWQARTARRWTGRTGSAIPGP